MNRLFLVILYMNFVVRWKMKFLKLRSTCLKPDISGYKSMYKIQMNKILSRVVTYISNFFVVDDLKLCNIQRSKQSIYTCFRSYYDFVLRDTLNNIINIRLLDTIFTLRSCTKSKSSPIKKFCPPPLREWTNTSISAYPTRTRLIISYSNRLVPDFLILATYLYSTILLDKYPPNT